MYIYGGRVNNDSHNDGGRSSRVVVRSVGRAEEALDLPCEQAGANRLASMVGRSDEVGLVCDCGEEVLLEARVQTWDHPHLAQTCIRIMHGILVCKPCIAVLCRKESPGLRQSLQ